MNTITHCKVANEVLELLLALLIPSQDLPLSDRLQHKDTMEEDTLSTRYRSTMRSPRKHTHSSILLVVVSFLG